MPIYTPEIAATMVARSSRGGGQTNSPGHHADAELVAFAANDYESGSFEETDHAAPLTTSADRTRAAPVIAFDPTQITSAENRSNPKPGDPCHTLAKGQHAPIIAFSAKDHGADATEDCAPTLRAGGHADSHANAGVMPAIAYAIQAGATRENPESGPDGIGVQADHAYTVEARAEVQAVALRGRDGGATAELGGDAAHALRASGGGGDKAHALIGMQVRRLTPRETERLQGFPDDYTLIPYGRPTKKKLDADFEKYLLRGNPKNLSREDIDRLAKDGPRYKSHGNSWAINCVRWIGERIESVEAIAAQEQRFMNPEALAAGRRKRRA